MGERIKTNMDGWIGRRWMNTEGICIRKLVEDVKKKKNRTDGCAKNERSRVFGEFARIGEIGGKAIKKELFSATFCFSHHIRAHEIVDQSKLILN